MIEDLRPLPGPGIRQGGRDAAATRSRILDAATTEFSAVGLAGARIARIAERAGANQRMIYAYFGSKEGLFEDVLEATVRQVQVAVAFDVADLPGYAEQVFDFYRDHPHLIRLAMWQALERPDLITTLPVVIRAVQEKTTALGQAQAEGSITSALPAGRLLEHILALVEGSIPGAGHAETWTEAQRDDLRTSVTALTTPSRTAPVTPPADYEEPR